MKSIILLLTIICWHIIAVGVGLAQPQFDSVRVEMKNLQFYSSYSYTSFSHGSGSSNSTNIETSHLTFIVKSQSTFSNTTALALGYNDTIKFTFDTLNNIMGSFQEYYSDISSGVGSMRAISFLNETVVSVAGNLEVTIDRERLDSDKFSYVYQSWGRASGGETNHSSDSYVSAIPTSQVKVTFFRHLPLNYVGNSIFERSRLKIFPNPASQTISLDISGCDREGYASIYDLVGNERLKTSLKELNNLSISTLPPGIYYLRAGNQMQKFVIQR